MAVPFPPTCMNRARGKRILSPSRFTLQRVHGAKSWGRAVQTWLIVTVERFYDCVDRSASFACLDFEEDGLESER